MVSCNFYRKQICPLNVTNTSDMQVSSCATMSVYMLHMICAIGNVTISTGAHTFHIIGIIPQTNMPSTLHIHVPLQFYYSLHIDPTVLHISIRSQPTASHIYHTTAKYVQSINMPLKYQKYATCQNYSMCIYGGRMLIYMPK